ncbi:MAG: type II toxin-antitoxin system Phd/YefM family antitoxin [Dethiosulfatibacter sp.]|nr:type II toxin-antitoxin system Phd/YefM family antitoxin [Dethiosulfatibacter sp.]
MKISTKMIVSNSDMIKNYKDCRNKAEELGKIFILKNNRPDAVLLSIDEYENLSAVIEYLENFEKEEIERITTSLKEGMK